MGARLSLLAAAACCALLLTYVVASRLPAAAPRLIEQHPDVQVSVAGAVVRPGRYTLAWGSRLEELIEAAGGLSPAADEHLIAWGAHLTDGAAWVVASQGDPQGDPRIDINGASTRLLETLPGVGPVTAGRIIEARPFHSVDDLLRVRGIGGVRLEALRPHVTLGAP